MLQATNAQGLGTRLILHTYGAYRVAYISWKMIYPKFELYNFRDKVEPSGLGVIRYAPYVAM